MLEGSVRQNPTRIQPPSLRRNVKSVEVRGQVHRDDYTLCTDVESFYSVMDEDRFILSYLKPQLRLTIYIHLTCDKWGKHVCQVSF